MTWIKYLILPFTLNAFHFERICRLQLQCVVWFFVRFTIWSADTM